jgi:YidC/Oxa1 family membrane protein insertase
MFMPPPTDEASAMQQKMMKYMMIFVGLMFYKVASGLCLYFIASTMWSMAERKFLPKTQPAAAAAGVAAVTPVEESRAPVEAGANGRRRRAGRSKPRRKQK